MKIPLVDWVGGLTRKANSLVGLDIGSTSIKALELTRVKSDLVVTGFGYKPISPSDQKAEAIKVLLEEAKIRGRRVISAVSGRSMIVRYVNMPQMDDNGLKNAIRPEAEKYIPFDLDDVLMDWQRLSPIPGAAAASEMRVLLVAVKKNVVEEQYHLLQEMGLTSVVIDVDLFALGNCFELQASLKPGSPDDHKVVALVDIGASKVDINIMRGNSSQFTREVYQGGNDLTDAVAKKFNLESAAAEEKKKTADSEEEVRAALTPVLDDMANEINLSFDYYENQYDSEVDEVYLAGGVSSMAFLPEYLGKSLGKPMSRWNPMEAVKIDSASVDEGALANHYCRLAVSLGLAARLAG